MSLHSEIWNISRFKMQDIGWNIDKIFRKSSFSRFFYRNESNNFLHLTTKENVLNWSVPACTLRNIVYFRSYLPEDRIKVDKNIF